MEDQENNEIKILIDALKYTSNIIVDLTNKLTVQEDKINILENKLNKIQKISMENNLKLKTIDFDKLNNIIKYSNFQHKSNKNKNDSDEMEEYIIEKNPNKKSLKNTNTNTNTNTNIDNHNHINNTNNTNNINNTNNTNNITNTNNKINTQSNLLDKEPIDKEKNKIDKLIGSIVKRKNILNQILNNNKEKSILTEYTNIINTKQNLENSGLDLTIKTATNKSEFIDAKTYNSNTQPIKSTQPVKSTQLTNIYDDEIEQDKIADAQNNDLNKANNILKQIRRRGNFARKI